MSWSQKKRNKVAVNVENLGTIISSNIAIEGAILKGTESIRIDGSFKGDIDLEGTLVLGETGKIEGNIKTIHFIVAGHVKGNIDCCGQLHFASTANVNGDVNTNSLIVDDGAQLIGRYHVQENLDSRNLEWKEDETNESPG